MRFRTVQGKPTMEFKEAASVSQGVPTPESPRASPWRKLDHQIPDGRYIPVVHVRPQTDLEIADVSFRGSGPMTKPRVTFLISNRLEILESTSSEAQKIREQEDAQSLSVSTRSISAVALRRLVGRALCG